MERQLFVVLQNLTWKCCGSHENCSEVLPKNLFYGTPQLFPQSVWSICSGQGNSFRMSFGFLSLMACLLEIILRVQVMSEMHLSVELPSFAFHFKCQMSSCLKTYSIPKIEPQINLTSARLKNALARLNSRLNFGPANSVELKNANPAPN